MTRLLMRLLSRGPHPHSSHPRPTTACLTVVLLAMTCLAGAAPAAAQAAGEVWLTGRVVEASTGQAVPGASVRTVGDVARQATSGEDGRWRLGPLPPGPHTLRVEHLGYAPVERMLEVGDQEDPAAPANPEASAAPLEIRLTARPLALDALVVTAGRRMQRLADVPVATELVSRREIRETGASDLAAVLTERAGVELQGGHPVGAGVMLQGLGSERVLVLLDGQPFIGRISGTVDVSRIPTSMIERVEVVKGPQSTMYGSEAMGGVVNVITRSPQRATWTPSASITAGTRGRLDVAGSVVGGAAGVTSLVDLGRRTVALTPGWSAAGGAESSRWDGLAKIGGTPVQGVRLEASGLLLDERQQWRSGQLYHFADNRQWSGRLGAVADLDGHRFSPTLHLSSFEHLSRRATSEHPVPGTGQSETQRLAEAELLYGISLGAHALDAGLEARHEVIRSDRVTGGERTEETLEAFAQTTLALGDASLVPGVRLSRSNPWGTHVTPRVALMVRPIPEVALRTSAGEGFRAPSFKELHMEFLNVGPGFGYTVRGNPDLQPEVSRNVTASVEWAGPRTWVRAQAFENRFDNFIETRPVGDSTGITIHTYGNVDDGFTRGAELEVGAAWAGWRAEAGLSLLRAENRETGAPLLGRPERSGRGTVGYAHPEGLRIALTGIYTGETPMQRTDTGTEWREAFLRFDARAAMELPGGLELVAGVDNVLDARPAQWPGFTGRHLYTSLSWRRASGSPSEDR